MVRNSIAFVVLGILVAGLAVAEPEKGPPPRLVPEKPIPEGYRTTATALRAKFTPGSARPELSGYLGLTVQRDAKGQVVVEEVQVPDSPAAKAGVQKGDVLTRIDDHAIRTPVAFREWLQTYGPNKTIKLGLSRGGKDLEVSATLTTLSRPVKIGAGGVYLGLDLGDSAEGAGVFIERVSADSPAATAGLKNGDRVLKIDGKAFAKADLLTAILNSKKAGDTLTITVNRDNKEQPEVKVTLAGDQARPGNREQPLTLWKKDTLRLAVLPFDFPETKHNPKIDVRELEAALLSLGQYRSKSATDQPVFGSLHDWVREQSAGKLKLDGSKVFDWVEVGKKRGDYIVGNGTTGSNRTAVLSEAIDRVLSRDGEKTLQGFDAICFIYAGDRVRTNAGAIFYPHAGSVNHTKLGRLPYILTVEGGTTMNPLGGYVKPLAMMLGLPDLAARTENIGSEGLGKWCILSDHFPNSGGFGNAPVANRPTHLSAWAKEKLGWITPTMIDPTVKQKLILAPIAESPTECFKVLVRPDGSEYLLLENRRKMNFDTDLPSEGLLIWRVVNGRPILEESHGIEGPAGPTSQLAAVPYPSASNNAFTPDTTPSSRSPLGGGMPVHITEIKRLPDGRITFLIGYEFR